MTSIFAKRCFFNFVCSIFCFYNVLCANENDSIEKWDKFNEQLNQLCEGKVLTPFSPVETLVKDYLWQQESIYPVLDIGCETGKNAIYLIQSGYFVTLLDISPKAIQFTHENLTKLGLTHGIYDSIIGKIENLDPKYGPYRAVVGTYVFSFIHPDNFQKVMKENVLDRVESGGFFAGGFFGKQHAWSEKSHLSFVTKEQLEELFFSMGFTICEMKEKIYKVDTVFLGSQQFHTIKVIAQRD